MAWKCSLELTHVYNIYCGNTPLRAPQLRRSVGSHNPLWVCETHPEGRGSIWVDLLSRRNSVIRKSAAPFLHLRRAVSTHITPPTDPARRNIGSPVISRIFIRLSICLSPFSSFPFTSQRELPRAYTETYVGDTWIFISVSPLSRCAEILSWITI